MWLNRCTTVASRHISSIRSCVSALYIKSYKLASHWAAHNETDCCSEATADSFCTSFMEATKSIESQIVRFSRMDGHVHHTRLLFSSQRTHAIHKIQCHTFRPARSPVSPATFLPLSGVPALRFWAAFKSKNIHKFHIIKLFLVLLCSNNVIVF